MSTKSSSPIAGALLGKTKRAVLGLLYGHPDEAFYVREILRSLNLGQGAVQRELATLTDAGILTRIRRGNQVYYQANPESPVFSELKFLIMKTVGSADMIRDVLKRLASKIRVAFLYGSFGSGKVRPQSDMDLMIIGKVTFSEAVEELSVVQEHLRRQLHIGVYSEGEFRKKLQTKHHFIASVWKSPKVFIIGDQRELKGLAPKRLA